MLFFPQIPLTLCYANYIHKMFINLKHIKQSLSISYISPLLQHTQHQEHKQFFRIQSKSFYKTIISLNKSMILSLPKQNYLEAINKIRPTLSKSHIFFGNLRNLSEKPF